MSAISKNPYKTLYDGIGEDNETFRIQGKITVNFSNIFGSICGIFFDGKMVPEFFPVGTTLRLID